MSADRAFSLRIFVSDPDPDCLRFVNKSNWIGKALVFPRALLPQFKARPELTQTGVYLLLGPHPDGEGDMLYVGEGDPYKSMGYVLKSKTGPVVHIELCNLDSLLVSRVQLLQGRS